MVRQLGTERMEGVEIIRGSISAISKAGDLAHARRCRFTSPGFDRDVWGQVCGLGWPGILVPESDGGTGFDFAEFSALLVECGRALIPEPVGAVAVAAPYLPPDVRAGVMEGREIVLPALYEGPDDSGDMPETRLGREGTVDGTKHFVHGARGAAGFLVTCADGLAYVAADAAGVTISSSMARDGSEACTVCFAHAPATPVPGRVQDVLDGVVLANASFLFGAMSQLFDMTLDYIKVRHQFGVPVASFQAIQHRACDLLIQRELSRAVLEETIEALEARVPGSALRAQVSRCKARIADAAMKIAQDCVQMHGAIGVTDEYDAGLFVRKILTLYNVGGSARLHRARYLGQRPHLDGDAGRAVLDDVAGLPDDYNDWDDEVFRLHVRQWIEANYPPELRYPTHRLRRSETRVWYDLLSARGWIAPAWPREYGGMGLGAAKRLIFIEEIERHGCARYSDQGVLMLGPLLMRYGTQAQRDFFLPKIITGEHIWAQGYSEPGSGSDLASLRTSAVLDGDHWVVNGQKIWTTLAHDANWIYALVRTDPTVRKQEGISFLLMPIDTPGITVRPIRTLCMTEEFCEVFFDNVRVPKDSIVGPLNQGWKMAKTLLGFERIFVGSPAQSANAFNRLETLLEKKGLTQRPEIAARRAELAAELADHSTLYEHFADKLRRGDPIGPDVSMLKINQTELFKTICRASIDFAGAEAGASGALFEEKGLDPSGLWFLALQSTIYGGTSEIQRNILAKEVLGLGK